VFLTWAIASADATGPDAYLKHDSKGHTTVGYNMFTGEKIEPIATTKGPSAGSAMIPSLFALVLVQLIVMFMFN
jgi:hypothetical protein